MATPSAVHRSLATCCLAVAGIACVLSACGRDAPLPTDAGSFRRPDAPSRLINPLCTGGGTAHAADTISTSVTWQASGNPHRVNGTIVLAPGGALIIDPGAVVCFAGGTGLQGTGGRVKAEGSSAAPIVLTAYDPAQGWTGVNLQGQSAAGSQIYHARVEYVALNSTAIVAVGHLLYIDSTVVRQSGAGLWMAGRSSRVRWSRVDTTTNRYVPAVTLGDSARFVHTAVLLAAGTGLQIDGTAGVRLTGSNRIEGSGGVGIRAPQHAGVDISSGPRVVGGQSYPIETTLPLLHLLYGSNLADQDSLKGNARDTVVMLGGTLRAPLTVRSGLPWHVKEVVVVDSGGVLSAEAATGMALDSLASIYTVSGGRVQLRGTQTDPVVLTADDPARGWRGIYLFGTPAARSYVTNARVEHVAYDAIGVWAEPGHPVYVDSAVFRQNGAAVRLWSAGSRLTRSRVDTTLAWYHPAVQLGADAILTSTLIRGASGAGLGIYSSSVQVQSCEVRDGAMDGIHVFYAVPVHNCNLVNNAGEGLWNFDQANTTDAQYNWWGDAGGPTAPGGDGVLGLVTYTPWRAGPFVLPYVP